MRANKNHVILFLMLLSYGNMTCKKSTPARQAVADSEITYEISSELFPNPERGFMKTLIVFSEGQSLDVAQLKLLRGQNISLALRVFYLDGFKDRVMNPAQLTLIRSDLDKFREAGMKAILRFAYTDDMNGTDASLPVIEQHLDQLKPIFEEHKDIIAFVQAGLIGAYGEWHTSSNGLANTEDQRKVLFKLLSVLPTEIMVQVRTPGYKQQIFETNLPVTKEIAYSTENRSRVGHHNDCFLSGGTDYGTYSDISAQKQYISNEASYVPTGGETCPPTGGYSPNCVEGQREMRLLKWTYLNLDYYPPTIAAWRASGCFDEFQRNLGYRLALVSAVFPKEAALNSSKKIKIIVSNKGYAPLYHQKKIFLVLKNAASGQVHEIPLTVDLRDCKPVANLTIDETVDLTNVPAGDYGLYLRIADQSPKLMSRVEYAIRLANTGMWTEENNGMNNLKHQLKIVNM